MNSKVPQSNSQLEPITTPPDAEDVSERGSAVELASPELGHVIQEGRMSRRDLLKNVAALGVVALVGERLADPTVPEITRHVVPMRNLKERVRVVQLSDLHRSWCVSDLFVAQAVDLANAQSPDIVALTGDFVTKSASYAISCAAQLKRLTPKIGTYAIPGNHDYWCDDGLGMPRVAEELAGIGIPMLVNKAFRLDSGLWFVGLDDIWAGAPKPQMIPLLPKGEPVLAITHNPGVYLYMTHYECTVLAGHTHGGQINVPYFTRKHFGKMPYLRGWYKGEAPHAHLYVSRGLGTVHIPVRINSRPEIGVFDFVPA